MASAASSRDPRELYLLKQKAAKYYEENGVPAKMEEILNSMFYEDPSDVYGHLVNFFSQFTKAALLSKLCATQVYDATGMPTVQTDVICTMNNKDKHVISSTIPSANIKTRPEDREKAELEACDSVAAAVKLISSTLSSQLCGMDPVQQAEIDGLVLSVIDKLKEEDLAQKAQEEQNREDVSPPPPPADDKDKKKSAKDKQKKEEKQEEKPGKSSAPVNVIPERPPELFVAGSEAVAAVSQAVCACAAAAQGIPLYRHVSNIARTKVGENMGFLF
ncbi:enolase 4 [Aplysia californica]|uniref:Enolase 4 n=1 Tax=Aplysia californica TaxID=6500 RepID=A0ABM0ZYN0_APLCA|nr:enolase 4 [Aplysia californica]